MAQSGRLQFGLTVSLDTTVLCCTTATAAVGFDPPPKKSPPRLATARNVQSSSESPTNSVLAFLRYKYSQARDLYRGRYTVVSACEPDRREPLLLLLLLFRYIHPFIYTTSYSCMEPSTLALLFPHDVCFSIQWRNAITNQLGFQGDIHASGSESDADLTSRSCTL